MVLEICSLVISLGAIIWSYIVDRKAKKLDLQLKELELQQKKKERENLLKADVEVNVIVQSGKVLNVLRFYNRGAVEARNVSFDFPDDNEDDIELRMSKDYLPYPKLLPQQNFDISFYCSSRKPHYTILISWDDAFAVHRTKEMVLDL